MPSQSAHTLLDDDCQITITPTARGEVLRVLILDTNATITDTTVNRGWARLGGVVAATGHDAAGVGVVRDQTAA